LDNSGSVQSSTHNAAGVLFGVALGDAIGAAAEFLPFDEVVSQFGPAGPEIPGPQVTDDTQMTLAVAEALLDCPRPITPANLEKSLRKFFIAWNESPDNNRAPGTSCVRSCLSLAEGYDWVDATAINSKGCGANMRVAPVALLNFDRDGVTPKQRGPIAQFQAAMTHGHPTALAAADLTAAAIADLLTGGDPADLLDRLRDYALAEVDVYHDRWLDRLWERPGIPSPQMFIREGWRQCLGALDRVEEGLARERLPADICIVVGEGWVAEEALACALMCFLTHSNDGVAAIRRAALTSGDSDSIAAITGALAGAHLGVAAWPAEWRAGVEYASRIARVADAWDHSA
jgi:ADP-ribosylglycohydrolase